VDKTGVGQTPQREPSDRRAIVQGGEWLVLDSKLSQIDIEEWERCEAMEQVERESLVEVMGRWKAIVEGGDRA
jgi:hypothetical protein